MQNIGSIIYPALAAPLNELWPWDWALFPTELSCVWSHVYWRTVCKHQTHTTETRNLLEYYIVVFHTTSKDIVTTFRMSNNPDVISYSHLKNVKMQHNAKQTMEDEEKPDCGELLSWAQMEHQIIVQWWPTGRLQFTNARTCHHQLRQNSPHGAGWRIRSALWMLSQWQNRNEGNAPSNTVYRPLLPVKWQYLAWTVDCRWLHAHPRHPDNVHSPLATG